MANLRFLQSYTALDQHRAEMRQAARQQRARVAIAVCVGVVATLASYWIMPPLAVLTAGIAVLAIFFSALTGSSSVPPSALTGAEGEARVLRSLKQLPDDHVVFNQVQIPDPTVAGGRREIDFVVVAPTGVHLIEVKNTPGLIYVRPDEQDWPLAHKAGCGGRPGWNAIANPLRQVAAQTEALNRWLLQHSLVYPVQPIICFARSEVGLRDRELSEVPVLTADELVGHFARAAPLSNPDRSSAIRLLAGAVGCALPRPA
ncbi:nuclease-related domain-containing protein [Wenzhouxiangella limi]|uniref:NERD domain-containing protein n=1 Tax=Wenzhouxiangella limi TaxID=2707351 RepID=A0A845V170_9GAMM|nr:nuclease-related domain-containing protein [Wenzhouxiangella limi]NDY95960.1 NERD domain-containing protein [Wenzhouxiangella limi]